VSWFYYVYFQVTNPLVAKRADPWVYKHTDGYYYFTATVPEYDRIELRRATTIPALSTTSPTVIWTKHSSGIMGSHIWAPELHYTDSKWYIHFAAGSTSDVWAIRIYVLENTSANPLQGTWVEKGEVQPSVNAFSLDAHYFEHNGTRYLAFAKADATVNNESCLFIASMSNPWTYSSTPVRISKPDLSWERVGIPVNEGAAVIKRNGKIFMVYSAAKTDANYCMGMLTASDTANLLSPSSWTKSATPVFQSSATNSQYGPGHCSLTVSPDGGDDILVYHARNYKDISGDPLNDPNRATRVQQFTWNADGTPNFGIPVADGTITIGGTAAPTPTPGPTSTPTPTPTIGPTPTPGAGPVVWYKFDETSGTTAADSSGNGKNATLVNGPTWVAGKSANAVNLDGTNDYVSMPSGVVSSLNDFTIATWVKLDTIKTWVRIFDFGTGSTVYMLLTPTAGSTIRFAITTSGNTAEQRINGTAALATGSWKHVAVTLAGSVGTLYVDGVQVGTNASMTLKPSSLGSTTQNWIGRSMFSADPYLDGQIDSFRIYNRALSAAEISGLYSAGN
jgi:GH43 family beta-xylosidase